MERSISIVLIAIIATGFCGAEADAQMGRSQRTLGRTLVSSEPPTTEDWLLVLGILARGADRSTEMAADATVCLKADGEVVKVLQQLYHSPGLEMSRPRLARPISGLQRADAGEEAVKIMMDPRYPPDHELCVGGAKSAVRTLGVRGVMGVVEKLSQWGELPLEKDLDQWSGLALAEVLSGNGDPDTVPALLAVLKGEEAVTGSGGRLGAACALLQLGRWVSKDDMRSISSSETNPTVRECLEAVEAVAP